MAAALTADIVAMVAMVPTVPGAFSGLGAGSVAFGAFTSSGNSIFDVARPVLPSNV